METSEYERRGVVEYLQSQSGTEFSVEHVEKIATEHVLGQQYDVWDAHTNDGRWWVITPPTNLYSQDQIRSMDIALSFHIGLMTRMMARDSIEFQPTGTKSWVLEVLRRLETARENLEQAREVEDVQAVGMRLRESLLTLTAKLKTLNLTMPSNTALPEQDGNFKGWAEIYASILASGSSAARLRKLLKSQSEYTWEYLGWLTHARNASILDGRLAYSATNSVIESFMFAVARLEREAHERCPECSSYQLSRQYEGDDSWALVCSTCSWTGPADPPRPLEETYRRPDESVSESEGSECIPLEDFAIYLTPAQARRALQESAAKIEEAENAPSWANPFAVRFDEDGSIHDVHRLVFASFNHSPAQGAELTYSCAEGSCVNPEHATETQLPGPSNWHPMLVEQVRVRNDIVELRAASESGGRFTVNIKTDALDRFGIGDASSILERVIFASSGASHEPVALILAARRVSFEDGSAIWGQLSQID